MGKPGIFRSWQASGSLTLSLRQKLAASLNMNCLKLAELFKRTSLRHIRGFTWFNLVQPDWTFRHGMVLNWSVWRQHYVALRCSLWMIKVTMTVLWVLDKKIQKVIVRSLLLVLCLVGPIGLDFHSLPAIHVVSRRPCGNMSAKKLMSTLRKPYTTQENAHFTFKSFNALFPAQY